jgi:hypothetical protein
MTLNMPPTREAGRTVLEMQIRAGYAEAKQPIKNLSSIHANAAEVSNSFTRIA